MKRLSGFVFLVAAALGCQAESDDGSTSSGIVRSKTTWTHPNTTATQIDPSTAIGVSSTSAPNGMYAYSPSIAQTSATSRHLFYAGDAIDGLVGTISDHVLMSVATRDTSGTWSYGSSTIAIDPADAPSWASHHTCDPSDVRGSFGWSGHTYEWALFFTATGDVGNNQIGVAYADSLDGPWKIFPQPIITEVQEFGPDQASWPALGVVHPSAVSVDEASRVHLFYKLSGGAEMVRLIDLTDVTNPGYGEEVAVTTKGLPAPGNFHSGDFMLDTSRDVFFATLDTGTLDDSAVGPNVQPNVTVLMLDRATMLAGDGPWKLVDTFGKGLSGETHNANAGMARDEYGRLPDAGKLDVLYTVANPSIPHGARGVFENRLWQTEGALSP